MTSLRLALVTGLVLSCQAFAPTRFPRALDLRRYASVADAPSTSSAPAELDPPTSAELKSETGADFLPLANALMAGEWKEADALTRDLLIFIAGPAARGRKFVYWTEVQKIPVTDMATLERLWLKYSRGKFGYSVQRRVFNVSAKGDFEAFCRKIDWNLVDDGLERKRRWFGADEFIYSLDGAPKGHLPLTSALRGVQLIKAIFQHPAFDLPEFEQSGKGKYDAK